jgi:hypothetical protein
MSIGLPRFHYTTPGSYAAKNFKVYIVLHLQAGVRSL